MKSIKAINAFRVVNDRTLKTVTSAEGNGNVSIVSTEPFVKSTLSSTSSCKRQEIQARLLHARPKARTTSTRRRVRCLGYQRCKDGSVMVIISSHLNCSRNMFHCSSGCSVAKSSKVNSSMCEDAAAGN